MSRKNAKSTGLTLEWVYQGIVQSCRERGIVPVWGFLPITLEDPWQDDTASLLRAAEESGFIVLNLVDVYRNHDMKSLRVAEWDTHPNAQAYRCQALRCTLGEKKGHFLSRFELARRGK